MARNRNNLDEIEVRQKYGFLYNGYKKNFYFWESINMYRKIWVIFVSSFLKLAGIITQALVIFLILIIFIMLNIEFRPFAFHVLNNMEILSFIAWMLTTYWGLFFLSDMPEVYSSTDSDVKAADNGCKWSYVNLFSETKRRFKTIFLFSNRNFKSRFPFILDI